MSNIFGLLHYEEVPEGATKVPCFQIWTTIYPCAGNEVTFLY